ncbi:MAG TPA: recombination-associated protein RdgC [Mariprofundaceae bacterium]|nr:recombination-associated protein RdgC [Mariprofundaceae bacterium]
MWFRNLRFYRFEEPFTLDARQLNEALLGRQARGCGQMEMACEGWEKPLGRNGQQLVHETDGNLMLRLRREAKVLPASLVRELVEMKVAEIEEQTGRTVGRKEKTEIKEQLLSELLPRALVKATHSYAYIDRKSGWLIVDAGSSAKAEELIALLRKTLGTLSVVLPQTGLSPEDVMTRWLSDDRTLPAGFALEDECELYASGEHGGVVRCKSMDISADEVRAHLAQGKRVRKLALNWQERVSFVLQEDLSLRRLKFDDATQEARGDTGGDPAAEFDADFAIMGAEIRELLPALMAAMND